MKETKNLSELYIETRQQSGLNTLYESNKNISTSLDLMKARNASSAEIKEANELKKTMETQLAKRLEHRPFVLEEIKTGKVFAIENDRDHVTLVVKMINEQLGNYMETTKFKDSLNKHYNLYTGRELIQVVNNIQNAPKFELHDSREWALKNNLKLSKEFVKKQTKGISFECCNLVLDNCILV